jgi:hypothetical protein
VTYADPHKKFIVGIRLEFGGSELPNPDSLNIDDTPTVIRLTSSTGDESIDEDSGAESYDSAPELEVVYGKLTGGVEEEETTVDILEDYLLPEMTSGPFSPVEIEIREMVTGDSGDETRVSFRGWVTAFIKNPEGRRRTVRLLCFTDKDRLDRKACMPADSQCVWALFGRGCRNVNTDTGFPSAQTQPEGSGPAIDDYISACVVTVIDGTTVTVEDLNDVGVLNGDIWQAGYLEYRGLRLNIRDWDKDATTPQGGGLVTTTFELVKIPPASWLNATMRAVPGCPKFPEECTLRYDNLKNIMNPGVGIKSYNPMIESP